MEIQKGDMFINPDTRDIVMIVEIKQSFEGKVFVLNDDKKWDETTFVNHHRKVIKESYPKGDYYVEIKP